MPTSARNTLYGTVDSVITGSANADISAIFKASGVIIGMH